jgi:tetratricopeptide (TPR) repeat protein
MKLSATWTTAIFSLVGLAMLAGGCERVTPTHTGLYSREPAPWTITGPADKIAVENNPQELDAATALEKARVNYDHRLVVLQSYYNHIGNVDKEKDARLEVANLREAQTFKWEGVPDVAPPPAGENIADADERVLVEYVLGARRKYNEAAANLINMYVAAGNNYKAERIRNVLARVDPMHQYKFIMSAEIPSPDLRPTESIAQANKMFDEACGLFQSGKGIIPMFTTSYEQERKSCQLFKQIIDDYPHSDKIALCAYYIGEISKEYFNRNVDAVKWYERAWTWDPTIPRPARFQAASVYDYRLMNREKALECYRAAIQHEQFNRSNMDWAHERIKQLAAK